MAKLILIGLGAPAIAAALSCKMGTELQVSGSHAPGKCQIVGHSQVGKTKTYYATCAGAKDAQQVEYTQGARHAELVDPASRASLAKCAIDRPKFDTLIKDYESHGEKLENPKCYLTQWKGQMMFVANGVKGRCSFAMNKNRSEEFRSKTGVTPLYQCENGYFLAIGEKTATSVYKKSGSGWALDCKATMHISDPVENIDWKNPPAYWTPDAGASGPNSGSAAQTASTQF